MNPITRFLPSFVPSLGALMNPWVLLVLLSTITGAFFYGLHTGNARLESYQVAVRAVGQAQEARTADRIKSDKKAKEKANVENTRTKRALDVALNSLRVTAASRSNLPSAPTGSVRPDFICFDRADLTGAFRHRAEGVDRFRSRVLELIGEGAANTVDLDTAKTWIQDTR